MHNVRFVKELRKFVIWVVLFLSCVLSASSVAAEAVLSARENDEAVRYGEEEIIITAKNGKKQKFKNVYWREACKALKSEAEIAHCDRYSSYNNLDAVTYKFVSRLEKTGTYILQETRDEYTGHAVVNENSGALLYVSGDINVGDDSSRFLALNLNCLTYSPPFIAIWRMTKDGFELDWSSEKVEASFPVGYEYSSRFISWKNDKIRLLIVEEEYQKKWLMELSLQKNKWKITEFKKVADDVKLEN